MKIIKENKRFFLLFFADKMALYYYEAERKNIKYVYTANEH